MFQSGQASAPAAKRYVSPKKKKEMMHTVADIVREPKGMQYRSLVAFALEWSDEFSLVTRKEMHPSKNHEEVMGRLSPFLARTTSVSRWPGTEIFGGTALVSFFWAMPAVSELLTSVVSSLYQWEMPDLPEDLAFYRKGSCWFGSIAHEKDSFLYPARVRMKTVITRVPDLKYELRRVEGRIPYGANQAL